MPRISVPLPDRLMAKLSHHSSGCVLWTGSTDKNGYGQILDKPRKQGGRLVMVHRVAYELWVGPIPEGLVIDHRCRVTSCCNPYHLEPVTQLENMRRSRKTQCKRGHKYTPETSRPTKDSRVCLVCQREYDRQRYLNRLTP